MNAKLTAEQVYTQFQPAANKLAHTYAKRFRRHHTDTAQAAKDALAMLAANWNNPHHRHYYDAEKCKPLSWVYMVLKWELQNHCTNRTMTAAQVSFSVLEKRHARGLTERSMPEPEAKTSWLGNLLRDLGDDARIVVTTLIDAPAEIAEAISSTRPAGRSGRMPFANAAEAVWNFLEKRHGWTDSRIASAWAEVRESI